MSKFASASIHPRVKNGRTVHEKVNTSKSSTGAARDRAIAGLMGHLERHPNDAQSAGHLDKLNKRK